MNCLQNNIYLLREGFKKKKSMEFSILWRPPPPGGYSMEFIYDFFSVPVSQIRIVCVATLGDLNTGYQDIHVETNLKINGILRGLFRYFSHLNRHIENMNQKPKFFTTILEIINKKSVEWGRPPPRLWKIPYFFFFFFFLNFLFGFP